MLKKTNKTQNNNPLQEYKNHLPHRSIDQQSSKNTKTATQATHAKTYKNLQKRKPI